MALPFQMTAAELADIRTAIINYTLPDVCMIETLSQVSDGAGGLVDTWVMAGTVACRLDSKQGTRKPVATSLESFSEWILTAPWDAPITTGSRVTTWDYIYTVKAVADGDSWNADTRAQVERIGHSGGDGVLLEDSSGDFWQFEDGTRLDWG